MKTCFTVLDDDGSNEVTPFEFKQLLVRTAQSARRCICFLNSDGSVQSTQGMPSIWLQRSSKVGIQGSSGCEGPNEGVACAFGRHWTLMDGASYQQTTFPSSMSGRGAFGHVESSEWHAFPHYIPSVQPAPSAPKRTSSIRSEPGLEELAPQGQGVREIVQLRLPGPWTPALPKTRLMLRAPPASLPGPRPGASRLCRNVSPPTANGRRFRTW